ncbi:MAG: hypothetical protein MJB14_02895 [Spirochaetes bacterium]|nr:hypothetical protein [Spirochaetota bacterium]
MAEQSNINIKWIGISMIIFLVAQIAVTILSPLIVIFTLGLGIFLLKPITYFLCGLITGYLSPGVTIAEPAIGAVIITVVGLFLDRGQHGFFSVLIASLIAFFCAVAGAKLGERMQNRI